MKKFKQIDCWISCILIVTFLIWSLIKQDETFIIGYFVVGGWHIISMFIHIINNWFIEKGGSRNSYHWIVFWIFATAGLGFIFNPLLYILLVAMLFAAPFMAVYYTWLCYNEVYVKMQRPIALLK